ncbi:hypothetical protein M3J09_009204 [Ascochyta lentis]
MHLPEREGIRFGWHIISFRAISAGTEFCHQSTISTLAPPVVSLFTASSGCSAFLQLALLSYSLPSSFYPAEEPFRLNTGSTLHPNTNLSHPHLHILPDWCLL